MPQERVHARYRIETPYSLTDAAEAMASEQSTGTFVDLPLETSDIKDRHAANVERITNVETSAMPGLPGAGLPADEHSSHTYKRGTIELSFPTENVGSSLQNLLTMVAGNLFELRELSGIKLLNIDIPQTIANAYPGPQFGIEGTREIVEVHDRPVIGTIIKPSIGLTPTKTGSLVDDLASAGLDFIKDDELIADPPYSPIEDRVPEVMGAIENEDANVLYACNITGDMNEMLDRADRVVEAGGNCLMVSMNSIGLSALAKLREEVNVPIHAHRNGWGALSRSPHVGFDYRAYHKFFRLAGADHLHVSGIRNKFTESDHSVIRNAKAVQTPITREDDVAMPVFSSGQWAGQAPDTYNSLGNTDLIYLAGGGILGHPDGPAAGVAHLKQGWDAAMKGIPLDEYAETHEELRVAIEHYGVTND
jgi:ribulose-bisphosphate carboxylase large chain